MPATTRRRGPLPRRVYWFRRAVVLVVAVGLVFGIARLLGATGGGSEADTATPVGAERPVAPSETGPVTSSAELRAKREARKESKRRASAAPEPASLAQPSGPCEDSDVLVTPSVAAAHAGGPIRVVLELTTSEADACTWEVSSESVFLTIANEDGVIWSSQDCPSTIPRLSVVPRREKADRAPLLWHGRESDDECSAATNWVHPGLYTATAVARGSVTPIDAGFVIGNAVAPTRTVAPDPTPTSEPDRERKQQDRKRDRSQR
jgi:hypothetical protein